MTAKKLTTTLRNSPPEPCKNIYLHSGATICNQPYDSLTYEWGYEYGKRPNSKKVYTI